MNNIQYGILGSQAPELELDDWFDANGQLMDNPVNLASHAGKLKIMFCFQSWCPGCHSAGFPTLKRLLSNFTESIQQEKIASWVVQTVFEGHEKNTLEKLLETQEEYQLEVPFVQDDQLPHPKVMTDYRTGGTPWFVIIDQNDRVIYNDFHIDFETGVRLINNSLAEQDGAVR